MDLTVTAEAPGRPEALFAWVDDLSRYPEWLTIVTAALPAAAIAGDPGPAWDVELRARIGPFARSKRLRMTRTVHEPSRRAVFERREADGAQHSAWRLTAVVDERPRGSHLEMQLHYGGGLWGPVLERVLADEIARGRDRLQSLAI